jgi:hypothetical protein
MAASTIKMPDGSTVSADQLQSMAKSNQIQSGANGSLIQNALDTGVYSGQVGGGQDGNHGQGTGGNVSTGGVLGTPASATNPNAAQHSGGDTNAGTYASDYNTANWTPQQQQQENVFDQRSNETYSNYAQRVGAQGTLNWGAPSLNPYSSLNPLANSPFTQWFQNNIAGNMAGNQLIADLMTNQPTNGPAMANQIQNAFQSSNYGPLQVGDAAHNLGTIAGMLGSYINSRDSNGVFDSGHAAGLSPTQAADLQAILNTPSMAEQLIMGQLQNSIGGIGAQALKNRMDSQINLYLDNPMVYANGAGQQGNPSGVGGNAIPLFDQLLRIAGIGY